jgi:hypothetical protein
MKITAIFESQHTGYILWDDNNNYVIGVITNYGQKSDKPVDITDKIINMVEDEYGAEDVKILKSVKIKGYEDKVFIEVETNENGEECLRKLSITRTGIY